jgi:TonB family protein
MEARITMTMTVVAITMLSMMTASAVRFQSTSGEQPTVVEAVAPVFPPAAIASNTSGKAVIEVQIDASGTVSSAKIVEGDPLFRQGKIYEETARRWQFAAAHNSTGMRTARLTFAFRIMSKDTAPAELTTVFMPPYQVEVRHRPFEPVIDKSGSR